MVEQKVETITKVKIAGVALAVASFALGMVVSPRIAKYYTVSSVLVGTSLGVAGYKLTDDNVLAAVGLIGVVAGGGLVVSGGLLQAGMRTRHLLSRTRPPIQKPPGKVV